MDIIFDFFKYAHMLGINENYLEHFGNMPNPKPES